MRPVSLAFHWKPHRVRRFLHAEFLERRLDAVDELDARRAHGRERRVHDVRQHAEHGVHVYRDDDAANCAATSRDGAIDQLLTRVWIPSFELAPIMDDE